MMYLPDKLIRQYSAVAPTMCSVQSIDTDTGRKADLPAVLNQRGTAVSMSTALQFIRQSTTSSVTPNMPGITGTKRLEETSNYHQSAPRHSLRLSKALPH